MTQVEKARAYEEALERARLSRLQLLDIGEEATEIEYIFPELKEESEDEKIRKELIDIVKKSPITFAFEDKGKVLAWLEKQGEPNPYSGTSFEYNGHIWGMCARDNGVDILCDKHIIGHLEKQGEQKSTELAKGEDYGIDGLWHAQRILEKTFGKVDGYQTDDGILSHECAISAVKELYEQNPIIEMKSAEESLGIDSETYNKIVDECIYGDDKQKSAWDEEDEHRIKLLEALCEDKLCESVPNSTTYEEMKITIDWINSIKERIIE